MPLCHVTSHGGRRIPCGPRNTRLYRIVLTRFRNRELASRSSFVSFDWLTATHTMLHFLSTFYYFIFPFSLCVSDDIQNSNFNCTKNNATKQHCYGIGNEFLFASLIPFYCVSMDRNCYSGRCKQASRKPFNFYERVCIIHLSCCSRLHERATKYLGLIPFGGLFTRPGIYFDAAIKWKCMWQCCWAIILVVIL